MENQNRPTVKGDKGFKFYNAGDRISEPISYSPPVDEGSDIHAIARFTVEAPSGEFFWVPKVLKFLNTNESIAVSFAQTIVRKFGERGVVMIDPEFEESESTEDLAIAPTDERAVEKGKAKWDLYLEEICMRHIKQVEEAKARGGVPLLAQGFTKRALKLRRYDDPAAILVEMMRSRASGSATPAGSGDGKPDPQVAELKSIVTALSKQVADLQKGEAVKGAKKTLEQDAALEEHFIDKGEAEEGDGAEETVGAGGGKKGKPARK
jgi:hypothetical protein